MAKKTQNAGSQISDLQVKKGNELLTDGELDHIAFRFNSTGQYGTMKMIHKALVYYNKYLKGEITKDEL